MHDFVQAFYFCRMERNILVVGGGLAGLCMGIQLYRRNVPFQIWASETLPCSSQKAAGIMNPVVVKRLLKTWMADEVLPYNQTFYPEMEKLTGAGFYSSLPVYRLFANENMQHEWQLRLADGSMDGFLSSDIYPYAPKQIHSTDFKGADMFGSSMVDCPVFIQSMRHFFSNKSLLKLRNFKYETVTSTENGYRIDDHSFSHIIFCEGMNLVQNPWFGKLPLIPTKGELLYLDIPGFPTEKEVTKGVFLAPQKNGGFVCGSTYEWQFDDEHPSDTGRKKIATALSEITTLPYSILNHTAGIRPASKDRRPYLGEHPEKKNMYVFNGLGTKGYMLAPYLSFLLTRFILDQYPLPPEMEIKRAWKKM